MFLAKRRERSFAMAYGIIAGGNFEEGMSIPFIPKPFELVAAALGMGLPELEKLLEDGRRRLFDAREKRVHPLKDDKILTAWNGLMIAALARGSQALGDSSYAQAAAGAADFILEKMRTAKGRLYRRYRQGEVANSGVCGRLRISDMGSSRTLRNHFRCDAVFGSVRLQEDMSRIFAASDGGFFYTGADGEKMIPGRR